MRSNNNYASVMSAVSETTDRLRKNRLTRRDAIRLFGSAGVAVAGLVALGRRGAFAQDGGTPAAGLTLGKQADGSTLWRVKVGDMNMAVMQELHAFFPGDLTVAVGDSVFFDFGMPGFHTVTFLSGEPIPPLQIPDPEAGTPAADAPPKMIFNPLLLQSSNGGDYDGTGYLNSGPDFFRDPSQPFIVRFTKAGSYDYLCLPHAPAMAAKINVVEAGAALPQDQTAYDAASAELIAQLYAKADEAAKMYATATETKQDDGTSLWEATVGAGEGPERVQAFLPAALEVTAGDTVKWVHRSPGEPHTVSLIGPNEVAPEDLLPEAFADGSPKFVQNRLTQLPQGGNTFSGTGFVNSGWLGIAALGLPTEWECTFDAPGEYVFWCILHGDSAGNGMAGKITVKPKA